jgi:tetratricopeptide (TPR) repeat protein
MVCAMNRLCASLVLGVLAGSAAGVRAEQAPAAARDPDLTTWFEAVEQHRPGFNDSALETIKSLSPQAFAQIRRALGDRRRALNVESFNQLVHRGAAMHMDAAMVLADVEGRSGSPRPWTSHRFGPTAVLSADGGFTGVDVTDLHWEYGRTLIDLTAPLPSEDETAKLWYVAAAAFMINRSLLADLAPHLEKGRKLFPADPDLLFLSGCYFEALSSPRVRPVIESTDLPIGVQIAAPSARESWRQAEYYFRRAAESRHDFAAARVRRARSLQVLGRHDESLSELRGAIPLITDPVLTYYAAIFEGAAHEALGNMTAARESYERAAREFPNAQSPFVALSRIARDRGDRAGAQAAMARVFARENRGERDDPWWTYHLWFVRNGDDFFVQLRQSLGPGDAKPGEARK